MIKFRIGNLVGFGLAEGNLKLLREGRPIHIKGAQLGCADDFLIVYGQSERDIVEQMRQSGFEVPPVEFDAEGNPIVPEAEGDHGIELPIRGEA
jgi:hypothetical protein